jgi:hypothetical protein
MTSKSTVWKPPPKYPPKATREINVASTFSPFEWMVDIMNMNESDRKSNDENINVPTLFNPVSKALIAVPMKYKMTQELVPNLDRMLEPLVITDKGMEFKSVMFKRLLEKYNLEGIKPRSHCYILSKECTEQSKRRSTKPEMEILVESIILTE